MNAIFTTFFFLFLLNTGLAQNLIPNPSFENYTNCPLNPSEINFAAPWYDPTGTSSDYFNSCAPGFTNVPYCSVGFQYARTGVGYAALWALNGWNNYREYVQIQLLSVLEQDSCYKITFYCNLHNSSGYAVNKIGLLISDTAVLTPTISDVLDYEPTIESNVFMNDTVNWMKVDGYYKAIGGEDYITIGNFRTDAETDTLAIAGNTYPGAYYLIDDISIEKITTCDTLSIGSSFVENNFTIYPNPNTGNFQINYNLIEDAKFVIYDASGRKIFQSNLVSGSKILFTPQTLLLASAVYLLTLESEDNELLFKTKMVVGE